MLVPYACDRPRRLFAAARALGAKIGDHNIYRALAVVSTENERAAGIAVGMCPPPTAANRLEGTSVDVPRRNRGGGAQDGLGGRAFGRACMAPGSARRW
jgi:hypothetical protein